MTSLLEVNLHFDNFHLLVRMSSQTRDVLEMFDGLGPSFSCCLCHARLGQINLSLVFASKVRHVRLSGAGLLGVQVCKLQCLAAEGPLVPVVLRIDPLLNEMCRSLGVSLRSRRMSQRQEGGGRARGITSTDCGSPWSLESRLDRYLLSTCGKEGAGKSSFTLLLLYSG